MTRHELKCWPEPFAAMLDGRKRFEWRRDDRGFEVGDSLLLREYDPTRGYGRMAGRVTGRSFVVPVTYILRGQFGVPEGYVVMGTGEPTEVKP